MRSSGVRYRRSNKVASRLMLLGLSILIAGGFVLASSLTLGRSRPERACIAALALGFHVAAACVLSSVARAFTPPGFLIAQTVLLAPVLAMLLVRGRSRLARDPEEPSDVWVNAMRVGIIAIAALSAARQYITPFVGPDERTYHASRAAYWLQHQSVFWFETHNERQVGFPFGGETFFAWGILFTREELVGKMLFWIGFPLSVLLVGQVCRAAGLGKRAAHAGALLYAATPAALDLATSLKSDLWSPVFMLAGLGLVIGKREMDPRASFLAGAAAALAVNVKTTLLAGMPGLLLLAIARPKFRGAVRGGGLFAAGLLSAALLSGIALTFAQNAVHSGNIAGSKRLVEIVRADPGLEVVRTHIVRVPLVLFELPEVPSELLRQHIERAGSRAASATGADRVLRLEENKGWPGKFTFSQRATATRFGLGGLLWLIAMPIAGVMLIAGIWRRSIHPAARALLVSGPLLAGVVILVRWMGGGPERFWIAAYATGIPMVVGTYVAMAGRWPSAQAWLSPAAIVLIAWAAFASFRSEASRLDWALRSPPPLSQIREPFGPVLEAIPRDAIILLFAGQNARDYSLFSPDSGYSRKVISWGRREFSPEVLRRVLSDHGATHIIFEHHRQVGFFDGGLRTHEIVQFLDRNPGFRRLEAPAPLAAFERVEQAGAP